MTTITPKRLDMRVINIGSTHYTVPSSTTTIVKTIDVMNTSASKIAFSLYTVPAASSLNNSNVIFNRVPIASRSNLHYEGDLVLSVGDQIKTLATISGLAIIINGVEIV
jgi:hypothetical protein